MSASGESTARVRRGRRALFTDPSELGAGTTGRAPDAPPSASRDAGSAGRGPSDQTSSGGAPDVGASDTRSADLTVLVECSVCAATVRRPLLEVAGASLRPFAWWVPVKRHSRWLRCTACGSNAWCRVDWLAAVRDR